MKNVWLIAAGLGVAGAAAYLITKKVKEDRERYPNPDKSSGEFNLAE
jgi:LPXTG-motif cell wall-anchored protein